MEIKQFETRLKYYYHCIQKILSDDKSVVGEGVKNISALKRLNYYLHGFSKQDIIYYGFPQNDYRQYISTTERLKLEDVNGRFSYILGEKVMLERIWGGYIKVPKTYSLIVRGCFLDLSDEMKEVDIISLLMKKKKLIAKPTRSRGGGQGVIILSYKNGMFFIDEKEMIENDFINKLRSFDGYMISDWIYQNKYANLIFPHSTNTIRIVTVMNHQSNKADVLVALHRFGTEQSKPVDNACRGGLFSYIDIKTGVCRSARELIHPEKVYDIHPSTGVNIKGLKIPYWDLIINKLKHAHNCFPFFEFLAWDVILSNDKKIYIVEINRGMDVHWLQIERPQRKAELGKYMRERGLLRKW